MAQHYHKLLCTSDITHFGKKYTHQDSPKASTSTVKDDPWKLLDKTTIEGIYRHYWLDFVLLGYSIPDVIKQ